MIPNAPENPFIRPEVLPGSLLKDLTISQKKKTFQLISGQPNQEQAGVENISENESDVHSLGLEPNEEYKELESHSLEMCSEISLPKQFS